MDAVWAEWSEPRQSAHLPYSRHRNVMAGLFRTIGIHVKSTQLSQHSTVSAISRLGNQTEVLGA